MPLRTEFTEIERVAIGELVELAQMLQEPPKTMGKIAIGALICERAASIIRGESTPYVWTNGEVNMFAQFWNVEERAAFNLAKGEGH